MDYKEFISDNKLFSLKLPANWSEYDDGDDGIFAFFNTEKWSGNLRITHLYEANFSREKDQYLISIIDPAWMTEKKAVWVKLNNWGAAFYINETIDDLVVYNWVTGVKDNLFICSLSFDKPSYKTDWHNNDLIVVAEIIGSIKIN